MKYGVLKMIAVIHTQTATTLATNRVRRLLVKTGCQTQSARSKLMMANRNTEQNMLAYLKKPLNLQRKTPKGQWSKKSFLVRERTRVKQKIRSAIARFTNHTLVTFGWSGKKKPGQS